MRQRLKKMQALHLLIALAIGLFFDVTIFAAQNLDCNAPNIELDSIQLRRVNRRPLPREIPVIVSKKEAKQTFNAARQSFESLAWEKYETVLQRTREGKNTKKDFTFLKDFRKRADILRRLFYTTSKNHEPPTVYDAFVRKMGKLNDLIEIGAKRKKITKAVEKLDTFTREIVQAELNLFEPSTKVETRKAYEETLKIIKFNSKSGVVRVEELHHLRKKLKLFLSHFSLKIKESPNDPDIQKTFKYLEKLNDALGEVNDTATAVSLQGEQKYKKMEVNSPKQLNSTVSKFAERVRLK